MKDNRLLKVLWGIVLAIFLCSALFIGISYFTGGDSSSSKKKDNETTSSSKDKDKSKDKDSSKSKTKEKSDEEKYREAKDSNNGNNSSLSSSNSSKTESNNSNNNKKPINNTQNSANNSSANNSNKEDKKEVTEANGGTVAPGTFNNSEAAHNYAKEEINRLAKENKKHYSYALERNNKGEVVVKITEG